MDVAQQLVRMVSPGATRPWVPNYAPALKEWTFEDYAALPQASWADGG